MNHLLGNAHVLLDAMLEDDELINKIARLSRKLFLELIKVGFTEEQAMLFVANQKMGPG